MRHEAVAAGSRASVWPRAPDGESIVPCVVGGPAARRDAAGLLSSERRVTLPEPPPPTATDPSTRRPTESVASVMSSARCARSSLPARRERPVAASWAARSSAWARSTSGLSPRRRCGPFGRACRNRQSLSVRMWTCRGVALNRLLLGFVVTTRAVADVSVSIGSDPIARHQLVFVARRACVGGAE